MANHYLFADSPMSKSGFIVLKFSQQQINIPVVDTTHFRMLVKGKWFSQKEKTKLLRCSLFIIILEIIKNT